MRDIEQEQRDQLRFLIASGNIRAALELLNDESKLRFTALYLLEDTYAVNFMLVDRDNTPSGLPNNIPLDSSYCSLVKAAAAPIVITDASLDQRLEGHPSRHSMAAYCGVPLLDLNGEVLGSLCQFDPVSTQIADYTVALMTEVATGLGLDAAAELRTKHLNVRVERLSDMQELLTSVEADDARAVFDDFAGPLLDEANRSLSSAAALEVEARISAIWWSIRRGSKGT